MDKENSDLITLLHTQAAEIAAAGHNGWGNTMLLAAEALSKSRITEDKTLKADHAPERIYIQHYDDYSGIIQRGHGNYYLDGNDNFDAVEYVRADLSRTSVAPQDEVPQTLGMCPVIECQHPVHVGQCQIGFGSYYCPCKGETLK